MEKFTKYDDFRYQSLPDLSDEERKQEFKSLTDYMKEMDRLFYKKMIWGKHERLLAAMECARN